MDPQVLTGYDWSGRTITYHREQVQVAFGFREFTRGDEDKLAGWLAEAVCPVELRDEQLREALLVRGRTERIEPPGRIDRIVGSARAAFEKRHARTATDLYNYGQIKQPATEVLMIAAEVWAQRTGWTDPSR